MPGSLSDSIQKYFVIPFVSYIVMVILLASTILNFPIYLYCQIIIKTRKWFSGKNEEPLCPNAQIMATELTAPTAISPRSTVIATLVVHGHIELKEFYETLERNCIKAVDEYGNLKYPQLQQYPKSRMGYLYWKQDESFKLSNHMKLHVLEKTGSDINSEIFLTKTCEQLLNKRYSSKRSPWEIHLVHNYKNSSLLKDMTVEKENSKLTLIIFGIHHCLGDGYSFTSLAMNLFGAKAESIAYQDGNRAKTDCSIQNTIIPPLKFFSNFLYKWNRFISFHFKPTSIFHADDRRKAGSQHYARAVPIPMHKVKEIKTKFGVKFATVINSCFAAALGKMSVKINKDRESLKSFVLGNTVPKPNHPMRPTFHTFVMAHEVPTDTGLNPVERLLRCEASAEKVIKSSQPKVFDFLWKLSGIHMARNAKYLAKNRFLGVATSNFRGPQEPLFWNMKKLLTLDVAAGGLEGVCGITICVFGYAENVQICAAAEKGIISEDDLKRLLELITDEIDLLHTMTNNAG